MKYYIEADIKHFRYWIDKRRELNGLFDNAICFTKYSKVDQVRNLLKDIYPNVHLSICKK